jgi:hypothetical protein
VGILKIETGNLKIETVCILLRDSRLPSLQHMILPLPLPVPPPDVMGGEGDEARGLQPLKPKGRLTRFEIVQFRIYTYHMNN